MLGRRPVLRNAGAVGCCAALLGLAGCGTGPVEVDSPTPPAAEAAACRALVDDLPGTVSGQRSVPVADGVELAAAWGDPPLVLRCGVGTPAGFDDLSICQVTDGVGWFVPEEQVTDGSPTEVLMTTVDRTPAVEVRLPPDYFPPAEAMVDLAPAIKRHTDQDDPCS